MQKQRILKIMEDYGYSEVFNAHVTDSIRTKSFRKNINDFNQKLVDCLLFNDDAENLFIKDKYISSIDATNLSELVFLEIYSNYDIDYSLAYFKNIWDEYIRPKKTSEEILTINKQPEAAIITGLLIGEKGPTVTFNIKIVQIH